MTASLPPIAPANHRDRLPEPARQGARRKGDGHTRQQILLSATKWFAQRGFEGASVNQIAADIGVPQPLINYHFENKAGLWKAVVDQLFDELRSQLDIQRLSVKDLTPLDALKVTLRSAAEFAYRRPHFFMIALLELRDDTERRQYLLDGHLQHMNQRMEELILAAQASGQIKPLPVYNVLEIMVGMQMVFYGKTAAFPFSNEPLEEQSHLTENHVDVIMEVLFAGLAR